ncbi:Rpn family recombination-promoting nuclease/putative transposase [Bacillus mycoides]|uniref:Rpn family recombination-promoting nuclease/putative transposase n=1 Tax=Bacillus mycoides TaxID=1405 RepID=UPI003D1C6AD4
MNQPLVNLRVDFAFKQLFGVQGQEELLISFLNAILRESLSTPIASLKIEDPHLHKEYEEDKLSILDILATLHDGTKVNPMLQKAIYKWENMSKSSSFRLAYEAREKMLFDEQAKLGYGNHSFFLEPLTKVVFFYTILLYRTRFRYSFCF